MLIQTALLQDHSCVNPPNRTETRRRREMGGWRRRRKEKEGGLGGWSGDQEVVPGFWSSDYKEWIENVENRKRCPVYEVHTVKLWSRCVWRPLNPGWHRYTQPPSLPLHYSTPFRGGGGGGGPAPPPPTYSAFFFFQSSLFDYSVAT